MHVEQAGRVLLDIGGAADIARAGRADLLTEAGIIGFMMSALALLLPAKHRRGKARTASASAAWHARPGR
jgi:hypothetical protein